MQNNRVIKSWYICSARAEADSLRRPMPGFLWLPDGKDNKYETGPEEVIGRSGSYRFSFPESMLSYYLDFPGPRQELANIFISRAWEWIFVISRLTNILWTVIHPGQPSVCPLFLLSHWKSVNCFPHGDQNFRLLQFSGLLLHLDLYTWHLPECFRRKGVFSSVSFTTLI